MNLLGLIEMGLEGSWKGNGEVQPKPIPFPALRCGGGNSIGNMLTTQMALVKAKLIRPLQGNSVVNKPLKSEVELCHYTGSLRGAKGSWAALSTCDGIEGVLYDGSTMHHIARLEQPELASHLENPHYVYSETHLKETNHTCGFHDTPGYHEHESPEVKTTRILLHHQHLNLFHQ